MCWHFPADKIYGAMVVDLTIGNLASAVRPIGVQPPTLSSSEAASARAVDDAKSDSNGVSNLLENVLSQLQQANNYQLQARQSRLSAELGLKDRQVAQDLRTVISGKRLSETSLRRTVYYTPNQTPDGLHGYVQTYELKWNQDLKL